jgi:hypothetical protein
METKRGFTLFPDKQTKYVVDLAPSHVFGTEDT